MKGNVTESQRRQDFAEFVPTLFSRLRGQGYSVTKVI